MVRIPYKYVKKMYGLQEFCKVMRGKTEYQCNKKCPFYFRYKNDSRGQCKCTVKEFDSVSKPYLWNITNENRLKAWAREVHENGGRNPEE